MSKIDPTQYKWFQYAEGQPVLNYTEPRHNEDYELEIHEGNVYGVKKRAHGIFVIHKHSPDIVFKLNEQELTRLMQHSKGWSGKIRKIPVKAGVGDLDKTGGVELPKGWLRIEDMNSSNLHFAIYDSKRKILYVAFHNGASWAYENVSKKEYTDMVAAESRGRYFNYLIKYVKPQYQIGRNFDLPPFDVAPTGPRKEPVAPKPKEGKTLAELEATPAPKTPTKPAKKSKATTFEIPDGMKVNGRAEISITHDAYPGKSTVKTWSGVGFEWLGAKHPELGRILGELATTGKAEVDDGKGKAHLTLKGTILVPADAPTAAPKPEPKKAPEKPGHAKRTLNIPKGAFHTWMDSVQNSAESNKPGSAFEILRRQRVDSEADLFKLLASLQHSTLIRADQRAFKSALKSVVALGDEYPLTARGKTTYKTLRAHVIAMGKRPATDFM